MKTPKPLQETNEPPFNQYVGRWVEVAIGSNLHYGLLAQFNVTGQWFLLSPHLQAPYAGNNLPYRFVLSQEERLVRYGDSTTVILSPYSRGQLEALIALRERELAPLLHEHEETLRQFEERQKAAGFH